MPFTTHHGAVEVDMAMGLRGEERGSMDVWWPRRGGGGCRPTPRVGGFAGALWEECHGAAVVFIYIHRSFIDFELLLK